MNNTKHLFGLSILFSLVIIISCEKDDINPANALTYGKLETVLGDNQTGYFGELLTNSITIQASSNSRSRRYLIKYEMLQGNGNLERDNYNYLGNINVDSTGILKIQWRIGCDNNIQKIKLKLYVDSTRNDFGYTNYFQEPSDSIIITANGTKPTGWARTCGCESIDDYSSKLTSFDDNTLYLVSHGLYRSIDGGLNWNKVTGVPNWDGIVDAQFNSLGWLYLLTENNGICYSKNLENWEYINNGILDHRNPTTFLVEDSTLFVSFYFDGPYKTSNNGEFWRKMLVGGDAQRFLNITRHPNGDIYLFDDWGKLWNSKDFGKSWESLKIEYQYLNLPAHDLAIDVEGHIYIGSDDATISKISPDTYTGESHSFYEMNHSSQHVEDIKIINNTVYFTVNGNPTPGLYSSQNWQKLDLGFNNPIRNYYLKKDGTFVLVSNTAIYVYNE